MKRAAKIYVTGSVQGMFYRQFIKDNADIFNLKGFVRKLEDLRIEIFVQGDHENIEEMINICKTGPKHAIIRNVEVKEERLQDFPDFKILNI